MKAIKFACFVTAVCACLNISPASAETDEELAKKLSNPIASLISVPFQYNYDSDYGVADDGKRSFINIQPVIPFDLNPKWNLISRTILPVIDQDDVPPGSGGKSGIGDVVQSLFFSPKAPTADGVIWGVGPVLLLPTASDELLGGEQWGLGPTGVALKQQGPWTYGALANHIWSVAGDDDRADVNATFLQPFLSYTTPRATTYALNTESTYNWEVSKWSVPINLTVTQLMKVGDQPVSIGGGVRYWAQGPDGGPEGWGARLIMTLLFPK